MCRSTKALKESPVSNAIALDESPSHLILADPKVYVDDSGTIYDASLNQSNVGNNNNKFYRLQLLENHDGYHVHTRWGRVGEFG